MSKVLIVDDNEDILDLLEVVLSSEGHEVICATGGKEADSLLIKHKKEIDAILSDYEMPEGDGKYLYKVNRKHKKPFIFHSSSLMDNLDNVEFSSEFETFFVDKPADPDDIFDAIEEAVKTTKSKRKGFFPIDAITTLKFFKVIDDLYIKLNEDHYVLISRKDFKNLSSVKNYIIDKDVKELYIQFSSYKKLLEAIEKSEAITPNIQDVLEITSSYAKSFLETKEDAKIVSQNIDNTIKSLKDSNNLKNLIGLFMAKGNFNISHSLITCFISYQLLKFKGISDQARQEDFYQAALMHNIYSDYKTINDERNNFRILKIKEDDFKKMVSPKALDLIVNHHTLEPDLFNALKVENRIFNTAHLLAVIFASRRTVKGLIETLDEFEQYEHLRNFVESLITGTD